MSRFVVTGQLRPGAAAKVAEILHEGPPFDLAETSLVQHEIFLGTDEIVFLFEGPEAETEARRLLKTPHVLGQAGRIVAHLTAPPRLPHEVFCWARPREFDGVAFGAHPGPGDSDGGDCA